MDIDAKEDGSLWEGDEEDDFCWCCLFDEDIILEAVLLLFGADEEDGTLSW